MFGRKKPQPNLALRAHAKGGALEERYRRGPGPPDEGPSDEDVERFSGVTVVCQACGTENYDDASLCYNCGEPIGVDRDRRHSVPPWAVIAAVLALLGMLYFVF